MPTVGIAELLPLITHVKKWVTNLLRAKAERKKQSKRALRNVIRTVRKTSIYLRSLREGEKKSIKTEGELSDTWTELSFSLKDIGLKKLADRCDIKGEYWAEFASINEADVKLVKGRLKDIENLARASLKELEKKSRREKGKGSNLYS